MHASKVTDVMRNKSTRVGEMINWRHESTCVGAGNFWVEQRIFARISPSLPEKFFCDVCLQIFSHNDHEDFFDVTPEKRSSCVFLQTVSANFWSQTTLGAIFVRIFRNSVQIFRVFVQIFRKFAQIFRHFARFSTNQNFRGALSPPCTPASCTTARNKCN